MNLKSCEKQEKSTVEIIIEVDAAELSTAIDGAFRKNRNSISIPGFRRGKAPRKIIENMYGASIFYNDAVEILAPQVMSFSMKESGMKIVSYPQVKDVDFKDNAAGVDITLVAAIYPEVTLGEYKGLSAVKMVPEVLDSEIDSELAGMQLRNARIEKAERPAINGDTAVIDYEGFVDGEPFDGGKGENHELVLGSNSFIAGFEEKIHGMVVGEERDLDLVFPENYVEHLAGKPVVFKVKLNELKEKILPELDDEFAKDVSEFDTLDDYKASLREKLLKTREEETQNAFENALMEKLSLAIEADVPDEMIEDNMDNAMNNFSSQISAYGMDPSSYLRMMNTTPEDFRENMRTQSETRVRITLALNKIAELEGIEVSEDDIEAEYKEAAERYGMELDDLKDRMSADEISQDVKLRRAIKIVTDSAIAEDPPPETETAADAAGEAAADAEKPAAKPKKTAAKKTAAKSAAADGTADTKAAADADAKPGSAGADSAGTDNTGADSTGASPKPKRAPAKKAAAKAAGAEPAAEAAKEAADVKAEPAAETDSGEKPKPKKAAAKKTKQGDETK